jgi:hypothetical protein
MKSMMFDEKSSDAAIYLDALWVPKNCGLVSASTALGAAFKGVVHV